MRKRRLRMGAAVLGLCLASAAPSVAQETLDLTILNQGKPPESPVQISIMSDGQRQDLGPTDANGSASFDLSILNLGKGTRVDVYVRRCEDGQVEIVLVQEGEDDPCVEEQAAEGERCGCERIGAFVVGDGQVVIDIGTGSVTQVTAPRAAPPEGPPMFVIGVKLDAASWIGLEDAVCDQSGITTCQADNVSFLFGPMVEVRLGRSPISIGAAGAYSMASFTQNFSGDPQLPSQVNGDVTFWALDLYGRADWWINDRFAPFVLAGSSWIQNKATFDSTFPDDTVTEEQTESGWRFNGGAGLDVLLTGAFGIRFNFNYITGGSNDADRHLRFGGGAFFGF